MFFSIIAWLQLALEADTIVSAVTDFSNRASSQMHKTHIATTKKGVA